MRKLFLPAVIAITFCSCAVRGGGGKSTMVGEDSWRDPVGAQVSIEARVLEINKESSLTAGVGFSLQGSAYEESGFSGKVVLSYINFPFAYFFQSNNGFYACAGLQPSLLLTAKDKYNGQSDDYKDQMKTFDLALIAEGGYRFNKGFGLGIRGIPGLTKNHKEGNSRNLLILVTASLLIDWDK